MSWLKGVITAISGLFTWLNVTKPANEQKAVDAKNADIQAAYAKNATNHRVGSFRNWMRKQSEDK